MLVLVVAVVTVVVVTVVAVVVDTVVVIWSARKHKYSHKSDMVLVYEDAKARY